VLAIRQRRPGRPGSTECCSGVRRHKPRAQCPRPGAKLRYPRAVEACPRARDRALALYAGCRIAETAALHVADVRLSARNSELPLIGKGEKSRTIPVHPQLRAALDTWLAERPS
jgi:integrase